MKTVFPNRFTLLLTSLVLSLFTINAVADNPTIEWAPFIKKAHVSDDALIAAADLVNRAFLTKQKGFIRRELISKTSTEYADLIYWETEEDAVNAGNKVNTCAECNAYFTLMDMNSQTTNGFSHYRIIKRWADQ